MSRTNERLQMLDCARGVAILAVFVCHSLGTSFARVELPWSDGWFRSFSVDHSLLALLPCTLGWTGVAVFFAVSGFCIHLSFISGAPGDWRAFFVRRFFRIYPPYLLALLLFSFVFTPVRLSLLNTSDLAQFSSHLLLLHNLDRRSYFGINPAFWSIAVEAQLYLFYPLLLALVRKTGWNRALWCVGVVEILMRACAGLYLLHTGVRIPRGLIGLPFFYWFSWASGAAVADAWINGRPLPFRTLPPTFWLAAAVVSTNIKPLSEFTFTCVSLWATSAIATQLQSGRPGPVFRFFFDQFLRLGMVWYFVLIVARVATDSPSLKPLAAFLCLGLASWMVNAVATRWKPGGLAPLFGLPARHLRFLGLCSYSFYLLHMPVVVTVPLVLEKLGIAPSGQWASLLMFGACMLTYPVVLALSWLAYRCCELPSIAVGKALLAKGPVPTPAAGVT